MQAHLPPPSPTAMLGSPALPKRSLSAGAVLAGLAADLPPRGGSGLPAPDLAAGRCPQCEQTQQLLHALQVRMGG